MTHSILLVDDSDAELELMCHYLETGSIKYRLKVAHNGEQALRMVMSEHMPWPGASPLSLIIMDYKMPVMSGVEAARALRMHLPAITLPIVMWSSSSEADDVKQAYAAGVNSYLMKPAAPAQMERVLRTAAEYWVRMHRTIG